MNRIKDTLSVAADDQTGSLDVKGACHVQMQVKVAANDAVGVFYLQHRAHEDADWISDDSYKLAKSNGVALSDTIDFPNCGAHQVRGFFDFTSGTADQTGDVYLNCN